MLSRAELIEKLFRSECSEEELHQLMDYMLEEKVDGDNEVFQRLWEELNWVKLGKEELSPDLYSRIVSKIEADNIVPLSPEMDGGQVSIGKGRRNMLYAISIASCFIICAAFIWLWGQGDNQEKTVTIASNDLPRSIILPDQSTVELSAHSELTYNKNWKEGTDRQVSLVGEAFFKVRKYPSSGLKFQVVTSDLTAEVLGTSFRVNTQNDQTEVFLEEGRVNLDLKEEAKDMLMEEGDVIIYSLKTRERSKQHVSHDKSIIWRNEMAMMRNISLGEILQNIEEMYEVKFHAVDPGIIERVFTIGIPIDNFETTLLVLKEVMKLNVVENNNQYIIQ